MPTIEISDKVYEYLQDKAIPLEDTANSVLERVFGLTGDTSVSDIDDKSTTDEEILGKEYYDRAILLILLDMGGEGKRSEVLKRVGQELDHLHSRKDLEKYKGGDIRWRSRAASQRRALISSGLMESERRDGIWKLTEKGREKARELRNKEKTD